MICYLLGKPERKEWELFPDINHRVIKLSQIEKVTFDRRKEMMVSKRLKAKDYRTVSTGFNVLSSKPRLITLAIAHSYAVT